MPTFPAIGQLDGADSTARSRRDGRRQSVMLMPLGTWGDVIPFVRLGRELQRRGHAVTLVACELFEPLARREGFEFFPLLDCAEYQRIFANPQLWHPRWAAITFLREAVLPFLRRQYEIVERACRTGECDTLVAPCQSLGARVAQERLGVPLVTVHLAPYMFRSAIRPRKVSGVSLPDWMSPRWKRAVFRMADYCGDQSFGRSVNAFRAELGLPRAKRVFWEWWNSPERIVGLFPDWFGEPQADWPRQTVLAGFLANDADESSPLTDEVEEFLAAGPAPILFTAGTAMAHGEKFFAESVKAARDLGARAILLSQYRDQLPDVVPAGMLQLEFVPLERLLRRVAAVVHHGGIGTTSQALAAGVPQLPVPMSFDQPDNAYRVECLGVGRSLARHRYNAATAAPVLAHLLNDREVDARCGEVAVRCARSQAVRVACDAIEALALVAEATSPSGGRS
jgi:UDP:flavonoid glycosyltransferase YjiC (YdhE family)